jgi:hypothetical protein
MVCKSVGALVVMALAVGVATADEFMATITKVDGNKITYQKYEKGQKIGDAVTVEVAADTVIADSKRGGAKKVVAGDAIEGGLKNMLFPKESGDKAVTAAITTDANNVVKQILIYRNKKK